MESFEAWVAAKEQGREHRSLDFLVAKRLVFPSVSAPSSHAPTVFQIRFTSAEFMEFIVPPSAPYTAANARGTDRDSRRSANIRGKTAVRTVRLIWSL